MAGRGDDRTEQAEGTDRTDRSGGTRGAGDRPSGIRHGAVAIVFACATPVALVVLPTVPALVVTPLLAAAALVTGIAARRRARRSGGVAPGTGTAIAVGAVGIAATLLIAPFWQPLMHYEQCVGGANTVQDSDDCKQAFDQGVTSRMPFASTSLVRKITSDV